jgi:protein arginine kinase
MSTDGGCTFLAPEDSPLAQSGMAGIVLSSRVRLARNVSGHVFPTRGQAGALTALMRQLQDRLRGLPMLDGACLLDQAGDGAQALVLLAESWLVSGGVADCPGGAALVTSGGVSVVINDEDHLRLQVVRPGLDIRRALDQVQQLDEQVGGKVTYAYADGPGYLTSCPSNLGTGMRASVMLSLPALMILGECDGVLRGLEEMGCAVRGVFGEGSEPAGGLLQISNQSTLGMTEEELLDGFEHIVGEVVSSESHARGRLLEGGVVRLVDYCARSLALIRYARVVSGWEAIGLLGGLRLGVECGIVAGVTVRKLSTLMVAVQPAHLSRLVDVGETEIDRDVARAHYLKKALHATVLEKRFR